MENITEAIDYSREIVVTAGMKDVGKSVASLLYDAAVVKALGNDNELKEFMDSLDKDVYAGKSYRYLVEAYLDGKIDSVTAIYTAMARVKQVKAKFKAKV